MEDAPLDLVLSYTVHASGMAPGTNDALSAALAKGYRVIDIVSTPTQEWICITILLTRVRPEDDSRISYYGLVRPKKQETGGGGGGGH